MDPSWHAVLYSYLQQCHRDLGLHDLGMPGSASLCRCQHGPLEQSTLEMTEIRQMSLSLLAVTGEMLPVLTSLGTRHHNQS